MTTSVPVSVSVPAAAPVPTVATPTTPPTLPAAELLAALRRHGAALSITPEGRLRVAAPAGALTPEARAALQAHKAALLALLHAEHAARDERGAAAADDAVAADDGVAAVRRRAPHDPRPELDARQRDAVWWSVLLATARAVGRADGTDGTDEPDDNSAGDDGAAGWDGANPMQPMRGGPVDGGAYAALHACRCLGAGLARTPHAPPPPAGSLCIVPGAIPAAGWPAVQATWLAPHRDAIADLLLAVWVASRLLVDTFAAAPAAAPASAAGLAADVAEVADVALVRRVWPGAQVLSAAEVAALEAMPVVAWRSVRLVDCTGADRAMMPLGPVAAARPAAGPADHEAAPRGAVA